MYLINCYIEKTARINIARLVKIFKRARKISERIYYNQGLMEKVRLLRKKSADSKKKKK